MRGFPLFLILAIPCFAQVRPASPATLPRFEDVSKQAGLTVPHISSPDELYIMESTSGGVGFIDCDNDGKLDIVVVNGSTVDRFRHGGDPMVTLYHQDADLKFKDVTAQAGLTRKGWGMGVAVADYDNDGWQDLYVTGYGGNVLYRNLGNCKFEDVTDKARVRGGGFSTGAAWGDYDRDGHVDLFVPRYVHEDMDALPDTYSSGAPCLYLAMRVLCGPDGLPGESDFLFHNKGDGTFEEVSKRAGVDDPNHYFGMQAVWADIENTGWPDLYVANDAGPNYLYRNKHDGTFEEVGLLSGTALNADGRMQASMGVDIADYARDGHPAILVTNFSQEGADLFVGHGELGFEQNAGPDGLLDATFPYVGWGVDFFDWDNAGWLDLMIANGHAYPQMESVKDNVPYREPLLLFRNLGDGKFEDVSTASGVNIPPLHSRRGLAVGDVNNDGKLDVLLLNVGEPPTLLINRTETLNHAAMFRLIGTKSNKAAIGAKVAVTAGRLTQSAEVRSGSSYLSQNDLRLHFGLGLKTVMENVEVSWPSGAKQQYRDLPADYIYTIVEDQGIRDKAPFTTSPARP
jgi:enediyne biosynthesis protein E4